MRLPELRVFFVVFSDWTTAFTQAHQVEQRKAFVCIHGTMVLFAWPRRAVIPEARRVAPKARGIDGESARQAIMSRAMDASRVLYPCQTRGSPVVVCSDFSVWQCSDRCDVRDAFDGSGSSPNQGPSCNIARAEGLQGRWDPSLGRRVAATPAGGHHPPWIGVPLFSLQDSH